MDGWGRSFWQGQGSGGESVNGTGTDQGVNIGAYKLILISGKETGFGICTFVLSVL